MALKSAASSIKGRISGVVNSVKNTVSAAKNAVTNRGNSNTSSANNTSSSGSSSSIGGRTVSATGGSDTKQVVRAGNKQDIAQNQEWGYQQSLQAKLTGGYSGTPSLGKTASQLRESAGIAQPTANPVNSSVTAYNKLLVGQTPTHADYSAAIGISNPDIINSPNKKLQDKVKAKALSLPDFSGYVAPNTYLTPQGETKVLTNNVRPDPSWTPVQASGSLDQFASRSSFSNYAGVAASASANEANRLLAPGLEAMPRSADITDRQGKVIGSSMYDSERGTSLTAVFDDPNQRGSTLLNLSNRYLNTEFNPNRPIWAEFRDAAFGRPVVESSESMSTSMRSGIGDTESTRDRLLREENGYNLGHYLTDAAAESIKDLKDKKSRGIENLVETIPRGIDMVATPLSIVANPILSKVVRDTYTDQQGTLRYTDTQNPVLSVGLGDRRLAYYPRETVEFARNPGEYMASQFILGNREYGPTYAGFRFDTGDPSGTQRLTIGDSDLWSTLPDISNMNLSDLRRLGNTYYAVPTVAAGHIMNKAADDPTRFLVKTAVDLGLARLGGAALGAGAKGAAKGLIKHGGGRLTPATVSYLYKGADLVDDTALVAASVPAGLGYDTRLWSAALNLDPQGLFQRNTEFETAEFGTPAFFVNVLKYWASEAPREAAAGAGWKSGFGHLLDRINFQYQDGLALPVIRTSSSPREPGLTTSRETGISDITYILDGSRQAYIYDSDAFMNRAKQEIDSVKINDVRVRTPIDATTGRQMTESDYLTSITGSADAGRTLKEDIFNAAKFETIRSNERVANPSDVSVYSRMARNALVKPINRFAGTNIKTNDPQIRSFSDVFEDVSSRMIAAQTGQRVNRVQSEARPSPTQRQNSSIRDATNAAVASFRNDVRQTPNSSLQPAANMAATRTVTSLTPASRSVARAENRVTPAMRDLVRISQDVALSFGSRAPATIRNDLTPAQRLPTQVRTDIATRPDIRARVRVDPKTDTRPDIKIEIRPTAEFKMDIPTFDELKKGKKRPRRNTKLKISREEYIFKNPFEEINK